MHKACSNCSSGGTGTRSGTSGFRRTDGTPTHGGRVHTPRGADSKSPARRCSGALLLLAIASLLIACGGPSAGANGGIVNLAWDPVTAANLSGYKIYYGTASGTYTQSVSVGNVTTFAL